MSGLGGYLWLEIRRTLRNRQFIIFTLGFPIGFYLLFTMLYGGQNLGSGAGALSFNAFYMVSMAAYGALGATMNSNGTRIASERAAGWSKQLRATPLPPLAYVLGKVGMAICVTVPAVVLVLLAGVLVHHVRLAGLEWVQLLLGLWLGAIPFATLGVLLGYLLDSESAQSGVMIAYFALSILGGLWFPYQVMPKAMQLIARLLPSYHYAAIGWNAVTGQPVGWTHVWVLLLYTVIFSFLAMRRYQRDEAREYA